MDYYISKKLKEGNMSKKKKFKKKIMHGTISIAKAGYGFFTPEGAEDIKDNSNDIFISARNLNTAMNGDEVTIEVIKSLDPSKGPEGSVKKVTKRNTTKAIGTLFDCGNYGFVIPSNTKIEDIYINKKNIGSANQGDIVEISITKYPKGKLGPEGRITSVIAKATDPRGDVKAILKENDIKTEFSLAAIEEARKAYSTGVISKKEIDKELQKRKDLRNDHVITIDGPHSKDLDDGVSIYKTKNDTYILGVHIADVSHYVREGSILDEEAFERGNSIYLLDKVVPMLPKQLSNGICSLNEGVDRLTLSCTMEIDKTGDVINHKIEETIINSKGRLVYDDVSDFLENSNNRDGLGNENIANSNSLDEKHGKTLKLMEELAVLLMNKRHKDGSLDFDLNESEIMVDSDGIPMDIISIERRIANRMIEEFMLIANKTVAEEYYWMNYPFVYRVHEKPQPERIMELKTFMAGLGLKMSINPDNVHPKVLSGVLETLKGDPRLPMVSRVMLRSMEKAKYSPECGGHYGLAFRFYSHFTSPIRRYPDLLIHRIIKAHINKTADADKLANFAQVVSEASEQSSQTELVAQKMERQIEKIKKAQYMENHMGEEFEGVISGVTNFGFYVELINTVEGLVHVSALLDHYDFDKTHYRLVGRSEGNVFKLGDTVKVIVARADKSTGQIDFKLQTLL